MSVPNLYISISLQTEIIEDLFEDPDRAECLWGIGRDTRGPFGGEGVLACTKSGDGGVRSGMTPF